MTLRKIVTTVLVAGALCAPTMAMAQNAPKPATQSHSQTQASPSKSSTPTQQNNAPSKAAQNLNVSASTFQSCYAKVKPGNGYSHDAAQRKKNKATLLPCLQKSNPNLTDAVLESVMKTIMAASH